MEFLRCKRAIVSKVTTKVRTVRRRPLYRRHLSPERLVGGRVGADTFPKYLEKRSKTVARGSAIKRGVSATDRKIGDANYCDTENQTESMTFGGLLDQKQSRTKKSDSFGILNPYRLRDTRNIHSRFKIFMVRNRVAVNQRWAAKVQNKIIFVAT